MSSIEKFVSGLSASKKRELTNYYEELKSSFALDSEDYVLYAIALLKLGMEQERIARMLSWSEFERFIESFLKLNGYKTRRSYYLKKPRTQIDIVAENDSLVLCIDCKHFLRKYSNRAIENIVSKQCMRAAQLKNEDKQSKEVIPLIVTIRDDYDKFVNGVPVVPVQLLPDFILNVLSYRESCVSF